MESLPEISNYVEGKLWEFGVDEKVSNQVELALQEVITNIIKYAYPDRSDGVIKVRIKKNKNRIVVHVEDEGIPFNPLDYDNPDVDLPLEKRSIGGLGIFIVKKIIDETEYIRADGKNRLMLIKYY